MNFICDEWRIGDQHFNHICVMRGRPVRKQHLRLAYPRRVGVSLETGGLANDTQICIAFGFQFSGHLFWHLFECFHFSVLFNCGRMSTSEADPRSIR